MQTFDEWPLCGACLASGARLWTSDGPGNGRGIWRSKKKSRSIDRLHRPTKKQSQRYKVTVSQYQGLYFKLYGGHEVRKKVQRNTVKTHVVAPLFLPSFSPAPEQCWAIVTVGIVGPTGPATRSSMHWAKVVNREIVAAHRWRHFRIELPSSTWIHKGEKPSFL